MFFHQFGGNSNKTLRISDTFLDPCWTSLPNNKNSVSEIGTQYKAICLVWKKDEKFEKKNHLQSASV